MILIQGVYNQAKIFTSDLEKTAREQIQTLVDQPFTKGSQIRIMPDVHAGAGCTIGTTMTLKETVVPNLVGVDIGCGMLTIELGEDVIDFAKLDRLIRREIPSGYRIRRIPHEFLNHVQLDSLICRNNGRNDPILKMDRACLSLGTLGGGNHFIEINRDRNGHHYLVVHSGSRHLGLQVALHYQRLAADTHPTMNRDLAYLEGQAMADYLHDMLIIQEYAAQNRKAIADTILHGMNWQEVTGFRTIHNYIDLSNPDHLILRKGAISARSGEKVLIPLNMRDGSLICVGKGNPDWNQSAPHGAGRIMSRREAKKVLSLNDFRQSMDGIFTTSICHDTLDEAPMAYKTLASLQEYLAETVDIQQHLTPVYNFKASGD